MSTFKILAVFLINSFQSSHATNIDFIDFLSPSSGRSLLSESTDNTEASSCYSCFSPGWGWSMGPFTGSPSVTYQFDMYKSNTNGCTRDDRDPETLTGIVTVSVTENDGFLEFNIIAQTLQSFVFSETHVYISTSQPSTSRPAPGKESSKCYVSGGSDATCSSASGATQIHSITLDTVTSTAIQEGAEFYFWIHAAETTSGDTVYGRSGNGISCSESGLESPPQTTVAPVTSPTLSPVQSPVVTPTLSPVEAGDGGACFHGDVTVMLESGSPQPLSELKLGDRIKTSDGEGKFSYSEVLVLPHAKNVEPAAFLTLTTESGKAVDMTSDHFIPKCDQAVVTAGELVVGDCVVTVDGKETLAGITSTAKAGVYTAVTKNKFIVVNGIVASAFSKDHDFAHPDHDYQKYFEELEQERLRKLDYISRKGRKKSVLSGLQKYLRG